MIAAMWVHSVRWFAVVQVAVFASFAVWFVPHANSAELHFNWRQFAFSNLYAYLGIGYLVAVGLLARAHMPGGSRAADTDDRRGLQIPAP